LTLCGLCFGLEAERRRPPTLTAGGCTALISLMGVVDDEEVARNLVTGLE